MRNQESFQIRWRGVISGPHGLERLKTMLSKAEISLMHEVLVDGNWGSLEDLIQQKQKMPGIEQSPPAQVPVRKAVEPPPIPAEDLYFVARAGQQEGPYSKSILRQLVAGGVLSPSDLIWKEGFPAWAELGRIIADIPRPPLQPPIGMSQPSGYPPQNPDLEDDELMQLFVGAKYPYYATKWQRAQEGQRKYSWNWAAFFFGVGWMAYRKMYLNGWLILLAMVSARAIEVIFKLPDAATIIIWLALWLWFGLWSNSMYQAHVEKKLSAIVGSSPSKEAARLRVSCDGGTNAWAVVGIYLAISVAMSLLELIHT